MRIVSRFLALHGLTAYGIEYFEEMSLYGFGADVVRFTRGLRLLKPSAMAYGRLPSSTCCEGPILDKFTSSLAEFGGA